MTQTKPAYSRILLKLSGEALMGDDQFGINRDTIVRMVDEIAEITRLESGELGAGAGAKLSEVMVMVLIVYLASDFKANLIPSLTPTSAGSALSASPASRSE